MQVDDIVLVVRNRSFGRSGVIILDYVNDGKFIKRFNSVGAWSLELPNDAPMVSNLKAPGAGLIVYLRDNVFISGPMLNWTKTESQDDPIGTTSFVGADDMIYLSDANAYPTPSVADPAAQTTSHDVRTGVCETVMKAYVNANIGIGAPSARRTPVGNVLSIGPNLARGASVTYSARFDQLGFVLQELAAAGGLGFDAIHSDTNGTVLFDVYQPNDASAYVRMDISNDLLKNTSSGVAAPAITRAIVAGQGEQELRTFIEVHDADSLAAEQAWGRRIEGFIDQRNTDVQAELIQAGQSEIEANGRTTVSLKVEPSDDTTMLYGRDWQCGTTISVIVDDQPLTDVVSEAIIVIDDSGARIGASIGDPVGYDWESVLTKNVSNHGARIAFLEKNA